VISLLTHDVDIAVYFTLYEWSSSSISGNPLKAAMYDAVDPSTCLISAKAPLSNKILAICSLFPKAATYKGEVVVVLAGGCTFGFAFEDKVSTESHFNIPDGNTHLSFFQKNFSHSRIR